MMAPWSFQSEEAGTAAAAGRPPFSGVTGMLARVVSERAAPTPTTSVAPSRNIPTESAFTVRNFTEKSSGDPPTRKLLGCLNGQHRAGQHRRNQSTHMPVVTVQTSSSSTRGFSLAPTRVALVGRSPNVDLQIDQPHISAAQCTLTPPNSSSTKPSPHWRIRDTSSNGTWVNGKYLGKDKEKTLEEGDLITFSSKMPFPRICFSPSDFPAGLELTTVGETPVASAVKRQRTSATPEQQSPATMEQLDAERKARRSLEIQLEKQRKELASEQEQRQNLLHQLEQKEKQRQATDATAAAARQESEGRLKALVRRAVG